MARFYVEQVQEPAVVRGMHDTGMLLTGAEGYRTQWASGHRPMPAAPQPPGKHAGAAAAIYRGMKL